MKTDIIGENLQGNDPVKTRSVREGPGATYTYVGAITPGTVFRGIRRVTIERDGEIDPYSRTGDRWWYCEGVKVKEDNTPRNGYVAEIHKGEVLLKVVLDAPLPDPDPEPPPSPAERKIVSIVATFDDGSTQKLV